MARTVETRLGVELTNLDQPLFDGAGATKRDLVDYLEAVAEALRPASAQFRTDVAYFPPARDVYEQNTVAAADLGAASSAVASIHPRIVSSGMASSSGLSQEVASCHRAIRACTCCRRALTWLSR